MNNSPYDWTASELFNYLVDAEIIDSDGSFEDWKYSRTEMIIAYMFKKKLNVFGVINQQLMIYSVSNVISYTKEHYESLLNVLKLISHANN